MEIYLIRHTTPDVPKGICYGQTDVPCAYSFVDEATQLVQQLPSTIDLIYSSPLQRCFSLATILSRQLSIPIEQDARLMEMNFGDWEMKPWENIPVDELNHWMANYEHIACPNGESYLQVYKRVISFSDAIKMVHHKKVAIVTHHGVMKCLWAHLNNKSLQDAMQQSWKFGEISRFTIR